MRELGQTLIIIICEPQLSCTLQKVLVVYTLVGLWVISVSQPLGKWVCSRVGSLFCLHWIHICRADCTCQMRLTRACTRLAHTMLHSLGLLSRRYVNKLVNPIELCIGTNVGQIFGFSLRFLVTLPKSAKRCPRPFSCGQWTRVP